MITIPKPNFAETNVPIGQSKDDYKDKILMMQGHVLNDTIDRVSLRNLIRAKRFSSKISSNVCKFKYEIFQIYDNLLLDLKSRLQVAVIK